MFPRDRKSRKMAGKAEKTLGIAIESLTNMDAFVPGANPKEFIP